MALALNTQLRRGMIKTIGLILAAGQSRRMGLQKALININDQPILNLHLSLFRQYCTETRVITGYQANKIRPWLKPKEERYNQHWSTTDMKGSLLFGVSDLKPNDRVLITPVDALPAKGEDIEQLMETKRDSVLSFNGQAGHPCIAELSKLTALLKLNPLCFATRSFFQVHCEWNCTLNFNTQEDWKRHFGALPTIYPA